MTSKRARRIVNGSKNLTELTNSEGVITIVNYIEEKKITSKNIICLENVSDPGNFGQSF